ncbi:hypothetical protein, partial [Mariprofundus micogutta]|uniref:hypothetical protein n=1 Tax=Mariprofundus micogutta TaxID=1921010 RepID=UPI001D113C37
MEAFTKRSQNLVQNNLWAEQRGSMNYKPCDQLSDSFTDWKILMGSQPTKAADLFHSLFQACMIVARRLPCPFMNFDALIVSSNLRHWCGTVLSLYLANSAEA